MSTMLKGLFGSEARIKILSLFFMNPGQEFYLREMERKLKLSPGQLGPELANLVETGILNKNKRANTQVYTTNLQNQLHEELKNIFMKTTGVPVVLGKKLMGIKGIKNVFIYGSYAAGGYTSESDIDVFITGDPAETKIANAINKAEKELNIEINYVIYTEDEIKKRKQEKDNFILTIMKGRRIQVL